jgi:ATP-binding cassette subfamily B (MDR/TAP) protein 1
VFVVATIEDFQVHQMDVTIIFLNEHLLEKIYMQQPKGFVVKGKENMVCKLQNSLYGLEEYFHEWNHKINAYFLSQTFERSFVDHNVYFRRA